MLTPIFHDSSCSICFIEYDTHQVNKCVKLGCGHIYHEECARPWLALKDSCPTCRAHSIIELTVKEIYERSVETFALVVNILRFAAKFFFQVSIPFFLFTKTYNWLTGYRDLTPEEVYQLTGERALLVETNEDLMKAAIVLLALGSSVAIGAGVVTFLKNWFRERDPKSATSIDYIPPEI